VHNEIRLMGIINHPFILPLQAVSQDSQAIYIFMEYIKYGNLTHILNHKVKFDRNLSEFYSAQIFLCLEYLHSQNLIYRDLKPDNILLTQDGFIKMADFGFIKRLFHWEKTYTRCGTPEYMSPEIILTKGYDHQADWWAFGIMLYELLYGRTPFMDDNPLKIMESVVRKKILFPEDFDPEAKNLIKKLTNKDVSKRYGYTAKTMPKIKNHSFFKHTNWDKLPTKEVAAPFEPRLQQCCSGTKRIQNTYDYTDLPELHDINTFTRLNEEEDIF
jgi:serine/threonine protein kinase